MVKPRPAAQPTSVSMAREFWHEVWAQRRIHFHESQPHRLLVAHVGVVEPRPRVRILVPLAGKSVDLAWLAERGHEVVGVELVRAAVEEFLTDRGLDPATHRHELGGHLAFRVGNLTLVCADFLELAPAAMGRFDAIYDRAALVAIEPSARRQYVEACGALLEPGGRMLLVSLEYDQQKGVGPPWSLDEAAVRELFDARAVSVLERREMPPNPRLSAAGVRAFGETAYRIG